jgi:hypothetical protein
MPFSGAWTGLAGSEVVLRILHWKKCSALSVVWLTFFRCVQLPRPPCAGRGGRRMQCRRIAFIIPDCPAHLPLSSTAFFLDTPETSLKVRFVMWT